MSMCRLDTVLQSYFFKRLINNKTLEELKFASNSKISAETMEDLIKYVMRSENVINSIDISFCIIQPSSLMRMFNAMIIQSKVTSLKLSSIIYYDGSENRKEERRKNLATLTVLGTALCTYFAGKLIRELDLSKNAIGNDGYRLLNKSLKINIGINVQHLNLSRTYIHTSNRAHNDRSY